MLIVDDKSSLHLVSDVNNVSCNWYLFRFPFSVLLFSFKGLGVYLFVRFLLGGEQDRLSCLGDESVNSLFKATLSPNIKIKLK